MLNIFFERRGSMCLFFVFSFFSLKDVKTITFVGWLPKPTMCLEFISQVPATGHYLRVAVIYGTPDLVNWGACKQEWSSCSYRKHLPFHAHLWFLCGQTESEGKLVSWMCNRIKFYSANSKGLEPHYSFHLKLLTKRPHRLFPSGSTVHCRECLGARWWHSRGGGGLSWDPQHQQILRPAEFCLEIFCVFIQCGTLVSADVAHSRTLKSI